MVPNSPRARELARPIAIYGVGAGAGAHHQFQAGGSQRRRIDAGAAHHQGIGARQRGGQAVGVEIGPIVDVVVRFAQSLLPVIGKLVGKQYLHLLLSIPVTRCGRRGQ